jgi:hypothetical protein
MHASPPFQLTVRRFGIWQAALAFLAAATAVVLYMWAQRASSFAATWVWLSVGLFVLCCTGVFAQAWRMKPMSLRWDTQRWYLGPAATAGDEPHSGVLTVAMDVGGWMLLHFVSDGAGGLKRGTWLPVQRHGHEAAWHALRATVYCARPVAWPVGAPF